MKTLRRLRLGLLGGVSLATLSAGVVWGCGGGSPPDDVPVDLEVATAPTPPIVGPVRVVMTLTGARNEPVPDATVVVEATMTHAGMTPVVDTARAEGNGRYVVPELEFTMGGDWVLVTTIELPDGRTAERTHDLRVIGARPDGSPAPAAGWASAPEGP